MSDNLLGNNMAAAAAASSAIAADTFSLTSISISSITLGDMPTPCLNPNANCWVKMSECDEFIGPKFVLIHYSLTEVIFELVLEWNFIMLFVS